MCNDGSDHLSRKHTGHMAAHILIRAFSHTVSYHAYSSTICNVLNIINLEKIIKLTVTKIRTERPGFDSQQEHASFLFATASRVSLGTTEPPIQLVHGAFSPG